MEHFVEEVVELERPVPPSPGYSHHLSTPKVAPATAAFGLVNKITLIQALQPWVSAAKLAHYSPAKEQQTARTTAEEGGFSRS